jgi:hypothetical protein
MIDLLGAAARNAISGNAGPLPPRAESWEEIAAAAERHGVAVLLGYALRAAGTAGAGAVHALAREQTRHALILVRQLRRIVDAVDARGIAILPVKGPVLATQAYGNAALRGASGDLDFCVRKCDFAAALAALETIGHTRHAGDESDAEAHLLPATPGTMVELHTELAGSLWTTPLDLDAALQRSTVRPMFSGPIRICAAEDLLLYLALHAARHLWRRLLWIADVAALLRASPSFDWEALLARAAEIEATQRLAVTLLLASQHVGAPVPDRIAAALFSRRVRRVAAAAERQLAATTRGDAPPGLVRRLRAELSARETFRQRVRYIGRQLAPNSRDRAWLRLPRALSWLYVAVRPVRLLVSFGAARRRSDA